MYPAFLSAHSGFRYLVLLLIAIVIIRSLLAWISKSSFTKSDNLISLILLITVHLQFLAGIILYFISPFVVFGNETMSVEVFRYWTIEHALMMMVAVVLITIARIRLKKKDTDSAKHRITFIYNLIAMSIVVVTILFSQRGLF